MFLNVKFMHTFNVLNRYDRALQVANPPNTGCLLENRSRVIDAFCLVHESVS